MYTVCTTHIEVELENVEQHFPFLFFLLNGLNGLILQGAVLFCSRIKPVQRWDRQHSMNMVGWHILNKPFLMHVPGPINSFWNPFRTFWYETEPPSRLPDYYLINQWQEIYPQHSGVAQVLENLRLFGFWVLTSTFGCWSLVGWFLVVCWVLTSTFAQDFLSNLCIAVLPLSPPISWLFHNFRLGLLFNGLSTPDNFCFGKKCILFLLLEQCLHLNQLRNYNQF